MTFLTTACLLVYKWSLAGTFSTSIRHPQNVWGLASLIFLDVLWVFSLSFFRRRMYNVFLMTHVLCFSLILPGVGYAAQIIVI